MPKKSKKTTIVKNKRCLMVALPERTLFTEESNYPELIEFARNFGAQISVVQVEEAELHQDLNSLASSLCNQEYKNIPPRYEIIETKILPNKITTVEPKVTKNNKSISEIQEEFKTRLLNGEIIHLAQEYKGIKDYTRYDEMYNAFMRAKKELTIQGWNIEKIKRGSYKATQQTIHNATKSLHQ